ncbi:hypothetical protein Gasu2_64410 [Galdieria sulphuraria]|nr:hypothetical protein Gasu2_64410 [Galdieria sulphuraria]
MEFVLRDLGLTKRNFVAVHLRNLDLDCHLFIANYPKWIGERVNASCPWNVSTVSKIVSDLQLNQMPLFIASDGQAPTVDNGFFEREVISLGNFSSELKIPAKYVDLFVLSEARVLFGNFISTFSNNAASMMMTKYPQNVVIFSSLHCAKLAKVFGSVPDLPFGACSQLLRFTSKCILTTLLEILTLSIGSI